jgi:hypothetical protein
VDAAGLTGTIGTLSVDVDLSGSRTGNWDNHFSSASLSLYDYTTDSRAKLTEDIEAGHYLLTISFTYGEDNAIVMALTSANSSFNEYLGGGVASFVDFYNTANISGLTFRDASGNIITNYDMITGSGHDYTPDNSAVPEPVSMLLLGCGLFGVIGLRRKFKA